MIPKILGDDFVLEGGSQEDVQTLDNVYDQDKIQILKESGEVNWIDKEIYKKFGASYGVLKNSGFVKDFDEGKDLVIN